MHFFLGLEWANSRNRMCRNVKEAIYITVHKLIYNNVVVSYDISISKKKKKTEKEGEKEGRKSEEGKCRKGETDEGRGRWRERQKLFSSHSEVTVAQSCPTLCDPMDYIVHGILQARILEWVAFPFSRGFSQPRDGTQVSHIVDGFFTSWATIETVTSGGLNAVSTENQLALVAEYRKA